MSVSKDSRFGHLRLGIVVLLGLLLLAPVILAADAPALAASNPAGAASGLAGRIATQTQAGQNNSSGQNISGGFDYYVIRYSEPPGTAQITQIQNAGFDIIGYSSGFRYIVRKTADGSKLISAPKIPNAAIERFASAGLAPQLTNFTGKKNITIQFFPREDTAALSAKVRAIAPSARPIDVGMTADGVNPDQVRRISDTSGIQYIDENLPLEKFDNRTTQILGANQVWDNLGYTGAGVVVAVEDTGLDTGNLSTIHQDLRGRVINLTGYCSTNLNGRDYEGHGTHVAGIAVGNGTLNLTNKGTSPGSQLVFQALGCAPGGGGSTSTGTISLFRLASGFGAQVHTNSFGSIVVGNPYYGTTASSVDAYTRNENPNITIFYAAGNSGPDALSVTLSSVGKNIVSVGNVYGYGVPYYLDNTSSHGPATDGRIKPDLVAPGDGIWSTCVGGGYCMMSGTSMASPAAAGSAALVYDYLARNRSYSRPSSALVRSILIAGAERIGTPIYGPIPNNIVGFGMINLTRSLAIMRGYQMDYSDSQYPLETGQSAAFSYTVNNSNIPLRVALVWTDPACTDVYGTCNSTALINDLDLKVIGPDGSWLLGNNQTANSTTADRRNVIEMADIDYPALGTYTVNVSAYSVPSGNQTFALAVIRGTGPGDYDNANRTIIPTFDNSLITNLTSTSFVMNWWTINVVSNSSVKYRAMLVNRTTGYVCAFTDYLYATNSSMVGIHTIPVTSLSPNTLYYVTIKSCSASGGCNESTLTRDGQTLVLTTQAISAPSNSNIASSQITYQSAQIGWNTNISANASVKYKASGDASWSYATDSGMASAHNISLTSLLGSTTYIYTVKSCVEGGMANTCGSNPLCTESAESSFTTPPAPVIYPNLSSVSASQITYQSAQVNWASDAAANSTVKYKPLAGSDWLYAYNSSLALAHTMQLSSLAANTTYSYTVKSCTTSGGCNESDEQNFTTSPPPPPVLSLISANQITNQSAQISWLSDLAADSTVKFRPSDSSTWAYATDASISTGHALALTSLSPSTLYIYTVKSCTALGGCTESSEQNFTTSQNYPALSAISAGSITANSANVTWNTDMRANGTLKYRASSDSSWSYLYDSDMTSAHNITLSSLSASTLYIYTVKSCSESGGCTESGELNFTTLAIYPNLSGIMVWGITQNSSNISWNTDALANSTVKYKALGASNWAYATNSSMVNAHNITLSSLSASTAYTYTVRSCTESGGCTESGELNFTTSAPPAVYPVLSSIYVSQITYQSAQVNWASDVTANSTVKYKPAGSQNWLYMYASSFSTSHNLTLSSLFASTLYIYTVKSCTSSANCNESGEFNFTTGAAPIIPVISAISISQITNQSAQVNWASDVAANSTLKYRQSQDLDWAYSANSSMSTAHNISLASLSANTTYIYTVKSCSSSGGCSESVEANFTTLATYPIISSITVSSITSNSSVIAWNTDFASNSTVKFKASGAGAWTYLSNSSYSLAHSISLAALAPNTLYIYTVKSCTASGGCTESGEANFTTSLTYPMISNIVITNTTSNSSTILWSTDMLSNGTIKFRIDGSGSWSYTSNSSITLAHNITLTPLMDSTTYRFTIRSCSASGGCSESVEYGFTTLSPPIISPILSNISASQITNQSAQVNWNTDTTANGTLKYRQSQDSNWVSVTNSSGSLQHSFGISSLSANTTYIYTVRSCTQSGGCNESSEANFTTLATYPIISSITVSSITSNSSIINWNTDFVSNSTVKFKASGAGAWTYLSNSSYSLAHSISLASISANTFYIYTVKSCTASGGCTESGEANFTTQSIYPALSNIAALGITTNSSIVSWNTDIISNSSVRYKASGASSWSYVSDASPAFSHSIGLTQLTPSTTYIYTVESCTASGGCNESIELNFTTATPIAYPNLTAIWAGNITYQSAQINWLSDVAANASVKYRQAMDPNWFYSYNSSLALSHNISLASLMANTTYLYTVKSCSASGGCTESGQFNFTTLPLPIIYPILSNITVNPITDSGAQVNWNTDKQSNGSVRYRLSSDFTWTYLPDPNMLVAHRFSIPALTASSTYIYTVKSCVPMGGCNESNELNFTTLATPPPAPVISNLQTLNITNQSAQVKWSTSPQANASVKYKSSSDTNWSYVSSGGFYYSRTIQLSSLVSNTTYFYTVKSCTAAGGCTESNQYNFTTLATQIVYPSLSAISSSQITYQSAQANWLSDVAANGTVRYKPASSSDWLYAYNSSLALAHNLSLVSLSANTLYTYAVESCTPSGGCALSSQYNFTTLAAPVIYPNISGVTTSQITNQSAQVDWYTDASSNSTVKYRQSGGLSWEYASDNGNTASHSIPLASLTADSDYIYTVKSCTPSGGCNESAEYDFTTRATPTQNVILIGVQTGVITNNSAHISWKTNIESDSTVRFKATGSTGSEYITNSSQILTHDILLSSLTPATNYTYTVRSCTLGGICNESPAFAFTTSSQPSAPAIRAIYADQITNQSAQIIWITNNFTNATVKYRAASGSDWLYASNSNLLWLHNISLSSLSSGTNYIYTVRSCSLQGACAESSENSFMTNYSVAISPLLSSSTASNITNQSAQISWNTDTPSNSTVKYRPRASSADWSYAGDATQTAAHLVLISSLSANATYAYTIRSCTPSGGCNESAENNFTTLANYPGLGSFVISTMPAGALVQVRNNISTTWLYSGTSPLYAQNVPTGHYMAYMTDDGYRSFVSYFDIYSDQQTNVSVPLTPLPVYDQSVNGSIVVYAEPEGALIRMRSRNVSAGWLYSGSSPMNMSSILPGDYVVFASKEHYPTKTVFAHVTAGQATVLNITLVKLN